MAAVAAGGAAVAAGTTVAAGNNNPPTAPTIPTNESNLCMFGFHGWLPALSATRFMHASSHWQHHQLHHCLLALFFSHQQTLNWRRAVETMMAQKPSATTRVSTPEEKSGMEDEEDTTLDDEVDPCIKEDDDNNDAAAAAGDGGELAAAASGGGFCRNAVLANSSSPTDPPPPVNKAQLLDWFPDPAAGSTPIFEFNPHGQANWVCNEGQVVVSVQMHLLVCKQRALVIDALTANSKNLCKSTGRRAAPAASH